MYFIKKHFFKLALLMQFYPAYRMEMYQRNIPSYSISLTKLFEYLYCTIMNKLLNNVFCLLLYFGVKIIYCSVWTCGWTNIFFFNFSLLAARLSEKRFNLEMVISKVLLKGGHTIVTWNTNNTVYEDVNTFLTKIKEH